MESLKPNFATQVTQTHLAIDNYVKVTGVDILREFFHSEAYEVRLRILGI